MKSKALHKLFIRAAGYIKLMHQALLDCRLARMFLLPWHPDMTNLGHPTANGGGLVSIGAPSTPFYSDGERWRPLAFANALPQAAHPDDLPPADINRGQIAYVSGYGLLVISDGYRWQALRTYPISAIVPPDPNRPPAPHLSRQGDDATEAQIEDRSNGKKDQPISC